MLRGKNIVLGVTGSIAAYKAVSVASRLAHSGANVDVIMTEAATKFVAPLSFHAITRRPVLTEMFELDSQSNIRHLALATAADLMVVAPATADVIAKLAAGLADDLLCCTILAGKSPVILAPAMDTNMYENSITQDNLAKLRRRRFVIVPPATGTLASGKEGLGRLAPAADIVATICQVLTRGEDLAGKRIIVTAGGTQEPIDPVRCVTNRSSGKMGYALAEAARDRGAEVTLITAPTSLPKPSDVTIVSVCTAEEMQAAVRDSAPHTDALIMAAAVADFRPKRTTQHKIKKEVAELTLELERTPDILASVQGHFVKIGFAAETATLIENATRKLREKGLDLIVANDITASDSGFAVDYNQVTIIDKAGSAESLPLLAKREVADRILDKVATLLGRSRLKRPAAPE
jgi:phosphopantothenoylcysteine decarboxylase/phosphopantothenate--cysteine ligase